MIEFGDMIGSYRVIGLSDSQVLAVSKTAADPYVAWHLDDDKCGVWGGRYSQALTPALESMGLDPIPPYPF